MKEYINFKIEYIDFKIIDFIKLENRCTLALQRRNGEINFVDNVDQVVFFNKSISTSIGFLYKTDCFRCQLIVTDQDNKIDPLKEYRFKLENIIFKKYLGRVNKKP